ncbi:phosphopantetheine adenylyltransferase, putative [Entamoeba invadens IP1]|uniref:Phosphopantetheine adenylyltransferase, putative n=1 Tax=Entamoeba invadens IP1 TaxID=370355 RepID=A0A0A1U9I1_ENTIV|nr:phosphopantetheine adenylyltransferase, putative [Entamoeba invadens IP1]ELP91672.1 phosphopantetheine adenylyltransferase, putative [Entamoeba invadens IP1]|eukprot:XP_004258443.1 phosphopantetheine adenylyltransferase, putative [Entamoeba invadens IP1]
MEIDIDSLTKKLLQNDLQPHIPKDITEAIIIKLVTKENTIPHKKYTESLTFVYQFLLELNPKYSTTQVIAIPTKPIYPLYKKVGMGGTFDRLHCGHYSLLQSGLFSSSSIFEIGISGDALLVHKAGRDKIFTFEKRRNQLENFVLKIQSVVPNVAKVSLCEIDTPAGTVTTDTALEAVVVSPETLSSLTQVNVERVNSGMKSIEPIIIGLICCGDAKVSSSTIRNSEK